MTPWATSIIVTVIVSAMGIAGLVLTLLMLIDMGAL